MDDAKDQQIFLVKQHFSAFTKNKFLLKFLIESLKVGCNFVDQEMQSLKPSLQSTLIILTRYSVGARKSPNPIYNNKRS